MIEVLYKAKVNDVVVDDSFCGDFDRYCYAPEDFITKDCIDCECQWLQNCLNSIHIECYNTYKVCNITVIYVWLIWSTKTREVALNQIQHYSTTLTRKELGDHHVVHEI